MGSIASGQKDKADKPERRDRTVNIRFSEEELRRLDDLRGETPRSEFLRDFDRRPSAPEPEYAAERRAGCPDLEALARALGHYGEQLRALRIEITRRHRSLKLDQRIAKDRGDDPGSVTIDEETEAMAAMAADVLKSLERIELSLVECRGVCGRPDNFGVPEPR